MSAELRGSPQGNARDGMSPHGERSPVAVQSSLALSSLRIRFPFCQLLTAEPRDPGYSFSPTHPEIFTSSRAAHGVNWEQRQKEGTRRQDCKEETRTTTELTEQKKAGEPRSRGTGLACARIYVNRTSQEPICVRDARQRLAHAAHPPSPLQSRVG